MTPERYAKLVGHHKAGAHAVATLADVDGLVAERDQVRTAHMEARTQCTEALALYDAEKARADDAETQLAALVATTFATAAEHVARVRREAREEAAERCDALRVAHDGLSSADTYIAEGAALCAEAIRKETP